MAGSLGEYATVLQTQHDTKYFFTATLLQTIRSHLAAQSRIQLSESRLCPVASGMARSLTGPGAAAPEQSRHDIGAVLHLSALLRCLRPTRNSEMMLDVCLWVTECSPYRVIQVLQVKRLAVF